MEYTKGKWQVINRPKNTHTVAVGNIAIAAMYPVEEEKANAEHIVEMHNKWDAFEAMRMVLEKIEWQSAWVYAEDMVSIKEALSLARGESKGE